MRTSLQIVNQPTVEPVSVAQLKQHIRIDNDSDDALLAIYGPAARGMAEAYTARCFVNTTLLYTIAPGGSLSWGSQGGWGGHGRYPTYDLPRSPVSEVESVVLNDVTGVATTLPGAAYMVDTSLTPPRIRLDYTTGLIPTTQPVESYQIQFVAGYGPDATTTPLPAVNAILIIAAALYEHRGDAGGEIPQAAEWLLDPIRVNYFGG